jgi:hypothetical protein
MDVPPVRAEDLCALAKPERGWPAPLTLTGLTSKIRISLDFLHRSFPLIFARLFALESRLQAVRERGSLPTLTRTVLQSAITERPMFLNLSFPLNASHFSVLGSSSPAFMQATL